MVNKVVFYVVNPAIYVMFSFGVLVFVYGIVEFLREMQKGGDTVEGKQHMLWGFIGMFIMVGVFGIMHLISNTFGFGLGPQGSYNPNMSVFNSIGQQTFQ